MARVTMTHPDLDRPIVVDEVSIPHYQASGWQVAEDRPTRNERAAARSRRQTKGREN